MNKNNYFSIKDSAKILGLSVKALYARTNNKKYKDCFVTIPNMKKSFLFYKKECIEKELNNRITEEDKANFTEFYYEVIDILSNGHLEDMEKCQEAEDKLKKILKKELSNDYIITKIIKCNHVNQEELKKF